MMTRQPYLKPTKMESHKSLIPKQKVIKSYTWDGKSLKEI